MDPVTYCRERADLLEAFAPAAAEAYRDAAEVFRRSLEATDMEPLTLDVAEVESGYTRAHLRRMLREGTVPNVGTDQEPRIRRIHLPRKPGHGTSTFAHSRRQMPSSASQVVRAVAAGE